MPNSGESTAAAAPPSAGEDPYFPPDSSRLRIGDDIDWSDLNPVYDRDDSLKENTNPKSTTKHGGGGASQRFSGNLKPTAAPIIGLPGPHNHLGHSTRRPSSVAIFPRKVRTGAGGRKPAVPDNEPGSPKVSCIGKVLSERERERRRLRRRRRLPSSSPETKVGCLAALFLCGRRAVVESVEESSPPPPPARTRVPARETAAVAKPEAEVAAAAAAAAAPELGGMKRFASGRRAAAWAAEIGADDFEGHVERSSALDH